MSPRWGSTPRRTDRLTVGRNVTMTLTDSALAIATSKFRPNVALQMPDENFTIMQPFQRDIKINSDNTQ
jgi:hypothetical protein